jgi:hypothetical protein
MNEEMPRVLIQVRIVDAPREERRVRQWKPGWQESSSFISLRAFFLSVRTGDNMLFSLGLSMGAIALGGMIGLVSDLFLNRAFNTFWFRYIGQTIGYLFIFLSTLRRSERYRRRLKRWHVIATVLLLGLLLLTPVIPVHPDPLVQTTLGGSRGLVCFIIFFHYVTIFFSKETRFGFLICFAFFWIAWGIFLSALPHCWLPFSWGEVSTHTRSARLRAHENDFQKAAF